MLEFVEGYIPGVIGRITELHGIYYGQVWGSVPGFEAMVATELAQHLSRYTPGRDLLLTAHLDGRLVGSILVDGTQSELPGARIRFVIVEQESMGKGIGRELMERAIAFAREAGFKTAYLWTVRGLHQSFSLYQRRGFDVVEEFESDQYGVPHTHLRMERTL
jgi:GNAT superfamily N-acetyltransferase